MKYVPIIKSKVGELTAIENLLEDLKSDIVPLIEILPDKNTARVNSYADTLIKNLLKGLKDVTLVYIDLSYYPSISDGIPKKIMKALRSKGITIIPVISPNSRVEAVELFLELGLNENGVCLRFKTAFSDAETIAENIAKMKKAVSIKSNKKIDFMVDFEYITQGDYNHKANSYKSIHEKVVKGADFRNVIVAGGSFPRDLTGMDADTVEEIKRLEWDVWTRIKRHSDEIVYSDYANIHPLYDPFAEAFIGSCSIKYSRKYVFVVHRGQRPDTHPDGSGQYRSKANELVNSDNFAGSEYSWGDGQIQKCADGEIGPGNAGNWVKYTVNHHFTMCLDLL